MRKKGIFRSRLIYDFNPVLKRRQTNFYRQFVGPGDLCFDIGAHTGNHTSTWLQLGARVVAVEPQSEFVGLMQKKFSDSSQFTLLQKAVAEKEGRQSFKISTANPTLSTLSDQWKETILKTFLCKE